MFHFGSYTCDCGAVDTLLSVSGSAWGFTSGATVTPIRSRTASTSNSPLISRTVNQAFPAGKARNELTAKPKERLITCCEGAGQDQTVPTSCSPAAGPGPSAIVAALVQCRPRTGARWRPRGPAGGAHAHLLCPLALTQPGETRHPTRKSTRAAALPSQPAGHGSGPLSRRLGANGGSYSACALPGSPASISSWMYGICGP